MILADDMGYSDLGSYGGEIGTPNLDALAAGGLRFTQFYATPRCSPTRAALLTGVQPHEAGMGWLPARWSPPGYTDSLATDVATLPEALATAGYRSYLAGKWHLTGGLGEREAPSDEARAAVSWPRSRGFDRFFGTLSGSGSYWNPRTLAEDETLLPKVPEGFHYTDAITDAAVRFVREHDGEGQGRPFFLYVAYTAPHWPLHARPEDVERYRGRYDGGWDALRAERHRRMKELGLVDARWPLSPRDPDVPSWDDVPHKDWQARRMEVYAAQVDQMDRGVGRIVDALRENRRLESTLILFLSDNGGCHEEIAPWMVRFRSLMPAGWDPATRDGSPLRYGNDPAVEPGPDGTFQSYGRGWANASNTPYRRFKAATHEGGIASPLIAHWPEGLGGEPGALTDEVGHVVDLMPTMLELASASVATKRDGRALRSLRGRSLAPALRGARTRQATDRELFFEHEGSRALRVGRWKLVSRWRPLGTLFGGTRWELYDLAADRTEQVDLAAAQPARTAEMAARWEAYAASARVRSWPWVVRPLRSAVGGLGIVTVLLVALAWHLRRRRHQRNALRDAGPSAPPGG